MNKRVSGGIAKPRNSIRERVGRWARRRTIKNGDPVDSGSYFGIALYRAAPRILNAYEDMTKGLTVAIHHDAQFSQRLAVEADRRQERHVADVLMGVATAFEVGIGTLFMRQPIESVNSLLLGLAGVIVGCASATLYGVHRHAHVFDTAKRHNANTLINLLEYGDGNNFPRYLAYVRGLISSPGHQDLRDSFLNEMIHSLKNYGINIPITYGLACVGLYDLMTDHQKQRLAQSNNFRGFFMGPLDNRLLAKSVGNFLYDGPLNEAGVLKHFEGMEDLAAINIIEIYSSLELEEAAEELSVVSVPALKLESTLSVAASIGLMKNAAYANSNIGEIVGRHMGNLTLDADAPLEQQLSNVERRFKDLVNQLRDEGVHKSKILEAQMYFLEHAIHSILHSNKKDPSDKCELLIEKLVDSVVKARIVVGDQNDLKVAEKACQAIYTAIAKFKRPKLAAKVLVKLEDVIIEYDTYASKPYFTQAVYQAAVDNPIVAGRSEGGFDYRVSFLKEYNDQLQTKYIGVAAVSTQPVNAVTRLARDESVDSIDTVRAIFLTLSSVERIAEVDVVTYSFLLRPIADNDWETVLSEWPVTEQLLKNLNDLKSRSTSDSSQIESLLSKALHVHRFSKVIETESAETLAIYQLHTFDLEQIFPVVRRLLEAGYVNPRKVSEMLITLRDEYPRGSHAYKDRVRSIIESGEEVDSNVMEVAVRLSPIDHIRELAKLQPAYPGALQYLYDQEDVLGILALDAASNSSDPESAPRSFFRNHGLDYSNPDHAYVLYGYLKSLLKELKTLTSDASIVSLKRSQIDAHVADIVQLIEDLKRGLSSGIVFSLKLAKYEKAALGTFHSLPVTHPELEYAVATYLCLRNREELQTLLETRAQKIADQIEAIEGDSDGKSLLRQALQIYESLQDE